LSSDILSFRLQNALTRKQNCRFSPVAVFQAAPVKIFVHDYPGHAFPAQLSRELARQGHTVTHAFAAALESPRGAVESRPDDPAGLTMLPIITGHRMDKYSLFRRVLDERAYGAVLAAKVAQDDVDLFITCTTPNDVLDVLRRALPPKLRVVWWLQDIYSMGIRSVLNRKVPPAGTVIGAIYRGKERRFAWRADCIVSITPDFVPFLRRLGVRPDKITVIENWAPVDEITPRPHDNSWKREQRLSGKTVILYSGTLGLKHNPALLSRAALHFQNQKRDDIAVVVATQGLGAEFLKKEAEERQIRNLKVLPWQPYERLPEVLATGDILTAIIEPHAGLFSVPSKILSCLCAGRPVVAAIPADNLAARTIERAGAGLIVPPGDESAFVAGLERLLADRDLRDRLGAAGRSYAEEHFDIRKIASHFAALCG
jgi:glycosyltransferase involved in cell wall biosynthesis